MRDTNARLEGIGSPSKYFDLPPASFGRFATVALNLANLAKPEQTNPVNIIMSTVDLIPIVNAKNAGATPKLIKSAKLSNS